MKRIVSLMIALLAIVAGASADDRTKISLVECTCNNFDTIPQLGNPIRNPTFIVTTGAPAYFDNFSCTWQKLVDGQWESVRNDTFTEGSWRYSAYVIIDHTTDSDNAFVLDKSALIKVNGFLKKIIDINYIKNVAKYVSGLECFRWIKVLFSIFPPIALQLGLNVMARFEVTQKKFEKGDLNLRYYNYCIKDMLIMFSIDFFIFLFLGFYLQNIITHDF